MKEIGENEEINVELVVDRPVKGKKIMKVKKI